MQAIKKILPVILLFSIVAFSAKANAQNKRRETVKIKTSAECNMCKATIEKMLLKQKGVKKATLDLTTQVVTIVYNGKKTNPDKLRLAITKIGYDADDMPADNKAKLEIKHNFCPPPSPKDSSKKGD